MACTVAGYDDTDDGVDLIPRAVDSDDPRPVWFCNWGIDHGSAGSSLKRALDRVPRRRGRSRASAADPAWERAVIHLAQNNQQIRVPGQM